MVITLDTEQVPAVRRWYADMTKADQLAQLLQNPILKEAIEITKWLHRPIKADNFTFTQVSEAERSHELARKEGIYYGFEWLDALASRPLEPVQKEHLTPFETQEIKKAKEAIVPLTEASLEPLRNNKNPKNK